MDKLIPDPPFNTTTPTPKPCALKNYLKIVKP
ncbi:hypothetical protein AB7M26_000241 [Pseudomonas sp. F-14 TE3482]|jgi:hypothetical protein